MLSGVGSVGGVWSGHDQEEEYCVLFGSVERLLRVTFVHLV